jgi:hypothetical protein
MKRIALVLLTFVACGGGAPIAVRPSPNIKPMCVMKGAPPPPVKYALVKPLLLGKSTYGGAVPLTVKIVGQARKAYADAIINYSGGQRFGFWPWRFLRPVVRGDAVRIDNPEVFDCVKLGGEFYSEEGYHGRYGGTGDVESDYERGKREMREQMERERGGR